MRRVSEVLLCTVVCLLLAAGIASAQEREFDFSVHTTVSSLREAREPIRVGNTLILSYDRERPLRYVAAVFAHENFRERHVFQRNQHDVYFLAYELPEDIEEVEYRLIADGIYTTDPDNPHTRRIPTDFRVSVADVSDRPDPTRESPRRLPDGRVEFIYEGAPNQRVYVTGSFSNWDPYMHLMEEVEPGRYRIRLHLREDTHYYHFIADGRRVPDPLNRRLTYNRAGRSVSRFDG